MIVSSAPSKLEGAEANSGLESSPVLVAGTSLDAAAFGQIRRRAILEGCKWDPQVGDVCTLAPFPLILDRKTWSELARLTEQLAAETIAAEQEILQRPDLLKLLGLPRAVHAALNGEEALTQAAARVMRFDFHPTPSGWRLSEVNSDVPGGFSEASHFTSMVAEYFPEFSPAGRPIDLWAEAVATSAGRGKVALLTAPGFMEDHQIVAYLAAHLRARGCETHLANPEQIVWRNDQAFLNADWSEAQLDAVVRFFQCEWLPRLPRRCEWRRFFRGNRTPVANPGLAAISESKRFPLTWDYLKTPLPAWRATLPETRDPRECPWQIDAEWLVKAAMSNTGDEVCIREWIKPHDWQRLRWKVWLRPYDWVAQRRFEPSAIETAMGPMHVCIGVYSINGRAAGIYGRLARRALIDYAAVDVAVLIKD